MGWFLLLLASVFVPALADGQMPRTLTGTVGHLAHVAGQLAAWAVRGDEASWTGIRSMSASVIASRNSATSV